MDSFLQKISKIILYISGWQLVNEEEVERIKRISNKSVWTFSHTSRWDALLFLLYKYTYPEIFQKTRIPLQPQVYDALPKFAHSFLNHIGFIKTTPHEVKNGGFIQTIVDTLRKEKEFIFMISPKGKRDNSPWRSGYYVVAKEFNCDLVACGLDYENKKIKVFDPIGIQDRSREEMDRILQEKLEDIVPLHPECSEVNLRKYKKQNIGLVGISFAIVALMIFMTYLSLYYKILFIAILILFFILL
jgi:hypothetical protein